MIFIKKYLNKELIFFILLPLIVGFIGYLLGGSPDLFNEINKPSFAPPKVLFPIVWTILYILMGISSYIIYKNKDANNSLKVYLLNLLVNMLWTPIFFRFKWFLFSFIWIVLLDIIVIIMIIKFNKINKTASYLQIPYLIWIIFASILNLSIYLLN